MTHSLSATRVWIDSLRYVLNFGERVSPRGQLTRELLGYQLVVDATRPVVGVVDRKMNYRFMAAEALWILHGDDSVAGIAPWNSRIKEYSDDGHTFYGAYGPPVTRQLDYVVSKLLQDPDTRQAVLTIWRQNPPPTKDYPCTVAMVFMIRGGLLHSHVFMRSNDAWLGTVYDIFNFSMILTKVACMHNAMVTNDGAKVGVGTVSLTAASFHLYEPQWEAAKTLTTADSPAQYGDNNFPHDAVSSGEWGVFERGLLHCRDSVQNGAVWTPRPL